MVGVGVAALLWGWSTTTKNVAGSGYTINTVTGEMCWPDGCYRPERFTNDATDAATTEATAADAAATDAAAITAAEDVEAAPASSVAP